MPVLPVVFRPNIESSAQKEEKLEREIRAAQTSTSNRPTLREWVERGAQGIGRNARRR